jgi:hypothetical protein
MTKVGWYAVDTSTTLESNKSLGNLRQSCHAPWRHHEACKWALHDGNLQGSQEAAPEIAEAVGALNVRARHSACATLASVCRLPGRLQSEPMGIA